MLNVYILYYMCTTTTILYYTILMYNQYVHIDYIYCEM